MRRAPGYTLLLVMLLLAAAAALAMAGLSLAGGERRAAASRRNEAAALAIAQAGLERTRGYLALLADLDGDLDRALDPNLDDDCATPGAPRNAAEDGLPTFPDGSVVGMGGSSKAFVRVPYAGGAYSVRIDDDSDDQPAAGPRWATNNHLGPASSCAEGAGVENFARDRNRIVVVTSVGSYPGTEPGPAQATRVLRARIGPPVQTFGLIAGGPISFGGASRVAGQFDSVWSTSSVDLLHYSGGGTAMAAGTCTANGSECDGNQSGPPAPQANPWDRSNAPLGCAGGQCTPFYYARMEGSPAVAKLFMWRYSTAGCENPRAFGRICYPDPVVGNADTGAGPCHACWTQVFTAPLGPDQGKFALLDSPLLDLSTPPPVSPGAPLFMEGADAGSTGSGCPDPSPTPGPGSLWPPGARPTTTFKLLEDQLPHGVWFLEGNLLVDRSVNNCGAGAVSIIALGDVRLNGGGASLNLPPAAPRGYAVLAGRDLAMTSGGESLATCGLPGAVLAHEQFNFVGDDTVQAQLVVENAASCSSLVSGTDAINVAGSTLLSVDLPGPIPLGASLVVREWEESGL